MQKDIANVCIRCGKTRIVTKTWKEYVGTSTVTYTTTACPDQACQKIVDKKLAAMREKRELFLGKRIQAIQAWRRSKPHS